MSSLEIQFADGKTKYRPGETIEGVAFWDLPQKPAAVELHLYWGTQGKGTVDLETVQTVRFDGISAQDRRPFRMTLPPSPYSVSGTLVSIVWGIEIVTEPKSDVQNMATFTMSPTGEEVKLQALEKKE
jgi:hypothetical protein